MTYLPDINIYHDIICYMKQDAKDMSNNVKSYEINYLKCVRSVSLNYYATLFIIPARVAKKRENIARF